MKTDRLEQKNARAIERFFRPRKHGQKRASFRGGATLSETVRRHGGKLEKVQKAHHIPIQSDPGDMLGSKKIVLRLVVVPQSKSCD